MERLKLITEVVKLPEWPPKGNDCSFCGQPIAAHTAQERKRHARESD